MNIKQMRAANAKIAPKSTSKTIVSDDDTVGEWVLNQAAHGVSAIKAAPKAVKVGFSNFGERVAYYDNVRNGLVK